MSDRAFRDRDVAPMVGVGASDVQHAVRAEVGRIIKETKGDELAQSKLLTGMLHERGLIGDADVEAVNRLAELSYEAGAGKTSATEAYFESRDLYNTLLASTETGPVALVLASSAVGSYEITVDSDGSDSVVFKKSSGGWERRGAATGAIVGSIWGPLGAAIGGAVGGAAGAAVDECTQD